MSPSPTLLRFAPSPNGFLHLGHGLSALLNHDAARRLGGQLLLRIEDIDRQRCRPAFEAAMIEDLHWLGIAWAPHPRRQSEHFDLYRETYEHLRNRGLLYPCFCSRRQRVSEGQIRCDPDGVPLYSGRCRQLSEAQRARSLAQGDEHVWRLDMARALEEVGTDLTWAVWTGAVWTSTVWQDSGQDSGHEQVKFVRAEPQLWGDVVLVRRDVPTSYHLSVVVDDALQNISHVLRGQDLYHATHIHRLLQALLSLPSPLYQHHRLIRDDEGHKLAKSNPRAAHEQSFYLRDLRKAGWSASELRAKLGLRVD